MLTHESSKYINSLDNKLDVINSKFLKKLFNLLKNHKFKYTTSSINIYNHEFPIPNTKYVDSKLLTKTKLNNNVYNYSWKINNKSNCNFYYYTKNNYNDLIIDKYIYIISYVLSLSKINHNINIHLTHLNDKKIFNNKYTSYNVNSGVTSFDHNISTVFVYRKEESVKVLIHELLHAINLSDIPNNSTIVDHYNHVYNIKTSSINVNETYTEIWAKLLNCFFVSVFSKSHNYSTFNRYVSIEKKFSQIQAFKIISFLNDHKNININKHTHIVGYFLCINQLFYNIDDFLKMRFDSNNVFILNNNQSFIDFMLDHTDYKTHKIKKNSIFKNTFRMTAVELNLSRG